MAVVLAATGPLPGIPLFGSEPFPRPLRLPAGAEAGNKSHDDERSPLRRSVTNF